MDKYYKDKELETTKHTQLCGDNFVSGRSFGCLIKSNVAILEGW